MINLTARQKINNYMGDNLRGTSHSSPSSSFVIPFNTVDDSREFKEDGPIVTMTIPSP